MGEREANARDPEDHYLSPWTLLCEWMNKISECKECLELLEEL
jgi:uncharacterized protein YjiS (DUF1127 family)